jgi:hypothetical protein
MKRKLITIILTVFIILFIHNRLPNAQTERAVITGTVTYEGEPVCAMVLANGQNMFSCGSDLGTFDLEVPLDGNGEITLCVFCSGKAPYKDIIVP